MPKEQLFFVIWNPKKSNPSHRHSNLPSAEAEAMRLARENPGHEFFILAAIAKATKQDVLLERFGDLDSLIPF